MTATVNARRALRWIMGAALVLGGWACGQAGGTSSTTGAGGFGPASTSGPGGGGIGSWFSPPDAGDPCAFTDPPRLPNPPKTPCDPASDAGACDLPPSVCANAKWLVYYINPQCIDGFCQWDKQPYKCSWCDCVNGGCMMPLTK